MSNKHDQDDPSQSPFLAMARELARDPDSPASLRIRSSVNASMKPSLERVEQIMESIAQQIETPGPAADAAFQAAKEHWENSCQGSFTEDIEKRLRADVAKALDRRRGGPPRIESILPDVGVRTDVGYDQGIHLQGLKGTWHRLWATIAMGMMFGEDDEHKANVAAMRAQFEEILGRPLSVEEWALLAAQARARGAEIASSQG
jgi:hypothetical protein